MTLRWVWISTRTATYAIGIDHFGRVVDGPPYARRLLGKRARDVVGGILRQGGDVRWLEK